ncbi:metal-dependent hydrolase [Haladaptatus sp. DYSN1]|uniref:metal-dependent hydrolase n=1 Tax=unclassified Haladaptatus TaxID=2622732 RepID=UPI002406EFFE|nr:metal-dependent hydrolase [Haladaptatus sp. DYSN1]
MWPWAHFALGYIFYSGWSHARWRRAPTDGATLVAMFGSQFPDLVDKPLAWTFHVLPTGRSLAHSALTATALVGLCLLVAALWYPHHLRYVVAFAIGYASHLLGDAFVPWYLGDTYYLGFLLWPVVPAIEYLEPEPGFLAHLLNLELDAIVGAELLLTGFVVLVWLLDGLPGLALLWRARRGRPREESSQ